MHPIEGQKIDGKIRNQIVLISGYHENQSILIAEAEVIHWVIVSPDGSEEGNWSGKFIDAFRATGQPPTGICDQID
jgi:hypothetical protein